MFFSLLSFWNYSCDGLPACRLNKYSYGSVRTYVRRVRVICVSLSPSLCLLLLWLLYFDTAENRLFRFVTINKNRKLLGAHRVVNFFSKWCTHRQALPLMFCFSFHLIFVPQEKLLTEKKQLSRKQVQISSLIWMCDVTQHEMQQQSRIEISVLRFIGCNWNSSVWMVITQNFCSNRVQRYSSAMIRMWWRVTHWYFFQAFGRRKSCRRYRVW